MSYDLKKRELVTHVMVGLCLAEVGHISFFMGTNHTKDADITLV